MPRRFGFLLLFLLVAFAARAEFPVTEERPLAPTLGISRYPQVVATESGFLAFWKTSDTYGADALTQIARLSAGGDLEARSTAWDLPLSFLWYDGASNGDQVLLAGSCSGTYDGPLCLARFSAAGEYRGLITLPFGRPVAPSVASNGDGFLVTFSIPFPREVLAIHVTKEGIASDAIRVAAWDPASQWTSPAAIGDDYFVAYGTTGGHVLSRLSSEGAEKTVALRPPVEVSQVRVAGSGDRLLVVVTPKVSIDPRMRAAVFDRDLTLRTEWFPLEGGNTLPRVEPTSSGWIVAARSMTGFTVVAVSRNGAAAELALVEEPSDEWMGLDAAARGNRALVAWTSRVDSTMPDFRHTDVRVAGFDDAGSLIQEPSTISLGPAPQIHPAAAHANGVTLAAWVEVDSAGHFVATARAFDAAGAPLSQPVRMPWRGASQSRPALASDGVSFFVVWSEGGGDTSSGIFGARLSPIGALLDAEPIPLFGSATTAYEQYRVAAVDWSGTAWIVVSSDERRQLVARRVSPSGTVIDAEPVTISPAFEPGGGDDFGPALDCNGSACLLAWHGPQLPWECRMTCPPPPPSIRAARIGNDLSLLDPAPHILTTSWEPLTWDLRSLGVSWNELADAWLVSWSSEGSARIRRDGSILPSLRSPRFTGPVSAIPEGAGWRLLWSAYPSVDLFHGWSATGTIAEIPERWALTATPERERDPRLVAAPRPLAFFLRESPLAAGSPQVFGRFLDEASGPYRAGITLSVARVGGGIVRLSWTPEADVSPQEFRIWALYDQWRQVAIGIGGDFRVFDFDFGAARSFRVVAETPFGQVESNVATLESARHRTVAR